MLDRFPFIFLFLAVNIALFELILLLKCRDHKEKLSELPGYWTHVISRIIIVPVFLGVIFLFLDDVTLGETGFVIVSIIVTLLIAVFSPVQNIQKLTAISARRLSVFKYKQRLWFNYYRPLLYTILCLFGALYALRELLA